MPTTFDDLINNTTTGASPGLEPTTPPQSRNPPPPLAHSIPEFCRLHGISQSFYFQLKKAGRAPVEMRIGRRRLISVEAAAEWRRQWELVRKES
jgi:hypothetical protein